ncbi:hypothetical protein [Burkholderia glumae]
MSEAHLDRALGSDFALSFALSLGVALRFGLVLLPAAFACCSSPGGAMDKTEHERSANEGVGRAGCQSLPDRSMLAERAATSGQPTDATESHGHKLPPDIRTEAEKAEDERAAALYWEERLADGYDAARDYAESAKANPVRWRFLGWLRFWR